MDFAFPSRLFLSVLAETVSTTSIAPSQSTGTPASSPQASARVTPLVLTAFAAVYLVWGSTYLAIRIGIESFPPLILAGLRHLTAGLVLYPLFRGKPGNRPSTLNWRTAAVTGFLLLFVGNGGVSWAEQIVPSGITALLVATVSLWLVIVDWLRPVVSDRCPRLSSDCSWVLPDWLCWSGRPTLVARAASIPEAPRFWSWLLWLGQLVRSTPNMEACPVRPCWE